MIKPYFVGRPNIIFIYMQCAQAFRMSDVNDCMPLILTTLLLMDIFYGFYDVYGVLYNITKIKSMTTKSIGTNTVIREKYAALFYKFDVVYDKNNFLLKM